MKPLEDIINEYEELRGSYRNFTKVGDNNRHTLVEFQGRFNDLKADLRYWRAKVTKDFSLRDDKASTAIKFRIAVAMTRGEYPTPEGEQPMFEKAPTITNAEKYAAASKEYKEFLTQRTFARESLTNISDLREDITTFTNEIKDRLK